MENRQLSSAFTGPPVFRWLAVGLLFTLLATPVNAGSSADWADWYQRSLEWQTGATPLPVPPEGLRLERGGASWQLESGEIRLVAPAPDGALTGMVFRGQGRFTLPVPDPREREFNETAEDLGPLLLAARADAPELT